MITSFCCGWQEAASMQQITSGKKNPGARIMLSIKI
jgi:hypothetical protein